MGKIKLFLCLGSRVVALIGGSAGLYFMGAFVGVVVGIVSVFNTLTWKSSMLLMDYYGPISDYLCMIVFGSACVFGICEKVIGKQNIGHNKTKEGD